jgi:flagellar hook-basal body complex protein FliE
MKKLLIIFLLFIAFCGCRTAKKTWVEDNFTSKETFKSIEENLTYSNETVKEEIRGSLYEEFSQLLKETFKSENETTSTTGSIEGVEGVEKSVTIGNTIIKSNGANVSFQTNNTKLVESLLKDFNEVTKKQEQIYKELFEENLMLEKRYLESEKRIETLEKTISKTVTKKQLGFGILLLLIVAFLGYLANKRFKVF